MNIAVVGTGYVGLVTGVCLSEIGHHVTCIDVNKEKINLLKQGISPIYEPDLDDLLKKNIMENRLAFTTDSSGYKHAEIVYIAVGTPQKKDGSADLTYVEEAAKDIAKHISGHVIVVVKSTVPVGTNEYIKEILLENINAGTTIDIVSNPEFLREGSAVKDTFEADRIVIGADNKEAGDIIAEINKPFNVPIFRTDIRSAEMIKYASNAFLATKISFINEIANICEKIGANIEDVSKGMGMDKRIGPHFLNAGIGYGGSCFPKDTNALVQIAGNVHHEFELLKSVIQVNNRQRLWLVEKVKERLGDLASKRIAILGLAFKPNTDDIREAPSIEISQELVKEGAIVIAYDPLAIDRAKQVLPKSIEYTDSIEEALKHTDAALILTEWKDIKQFDIRKIKELMKQALVFDGRNCFSLDQMKIHQIEYYSVGRPQVQP